MPTLTVGSTSKARRRFILNSDGWHLTARGWIISAGTVMDESEVTADPPKYLKNVTAIIALVKRLYTDNYAKIRYLAVLAKLMGLTGPATADAFDMAHAGALLRCEAHVICMRSHLAETFINGEEAVAR